MRVLYDVNALLALLDRNHSSQLTVSTWFADNIETGWSSCPLTQNGYQRIVSQPRYRNAVSLLEAFERLREATSTPYHQFLPDDISLLDAALVRHQDLLSYRQLTDVYLLALAVAHNARFPTLDTRIPMNAVRGATEEHLVVI